MTRHTLEDEMNTQTGDSTSTTFFLRFTIAKYVRGFNAKSVKIFVVVHLTAQDTEVERGWADTASKFLHWISIIRNTSGTQLQLMEMGSKGNVFNHITQENMSDCIGIFPQESWDYIRFHCSAHLELEEFCY